MATNTMQQHKATIMLSGGPDSAAAAKLLWQDGFDLCFVHSIFAESNLFSMLQVASAARIAQQFGKPLHFIHSETSFRGKDSIPDSDTRDIETEMFADKVLPHINLDGRFILYTRCEEDDYYNDILTDQMWNTQLQRVQQRYIPNAEQICFSNKQHVKDICGDNLWNVTWSCPYPRLTSKGIRACTQCLKCRTRANLR